MNERSIDAKTHHAAELGDIPGVTPDNTYFSVKEGKEIRKRLAGSGWGSSTRFAENKKNNGEQRPYLLPIFVHIFGHVRDWDVVVPEERKKKITSVFFLW